MMFDHGLGVDQDYYEAVGWYRLAALQGNAAAQNNLGAMYENECGVAADYDEALNWHRLAAQQGIAKAQNNLTAMYVNGRGVAKKLRSRLYVVRNCRAIAGRCR